MKNPLQTSLPPLSPGRKARKLGRLARIPAALGLGLASFYAFATLYSYRHLPPEGRTTVDDITTIEDAVEACRRSAKTGWELVEYARWIVARKMEYSRRNHWDSSARAFERGLGYCEQKAGALKLIYDRLGIDSWLVFAPLCRFPAGVIHGLPTSEKIIGHTWLHVRIGEQVRPADPRSPDSVTGTLQFEILSPVRRQPGWFRVISRLGSVAFNLYFDLSDQWRARRLASLQSTESPG